MINQNFYFLTANNTRLNLFGKVQLPFYIKERQIVEAFTKNTDVITISAVNVGKDISYAEVNIIKADADFTITLTDEHGNSVSATYNTGHTESYFYLMLNNIEAPATKTVISVPYLSQNISQDIEIECDLQTEVIFGDEFQVNEDLQTLDIDYDDTKMIAIKSGQRINEGMIDKRIISGYLKNNYNFQTISILNDNYRGSDYIGYSENKDVFIYNAFHEVYAKSFTFYIAPNTTNHTRTQIVTLKAKYGNTEIIQTLTITQQANPNGYDLVIDNKPLPALYTINSEEIVTKPIILPEGLDFYVYGYDFNNTMITNPYQGDVTKSFNDLTFAYINTYTSYIRRVPQVVAITLRIYSKNDPVQNPSATNPAMYEVNESIMVNIQPSGLLYSEGGQYYVDSSGKTSGVLTMLNNDIVSWSFEDLPIWLTKDNFNVDINNNVVLLDSAPLNKQNVERSANFSLVFERRNGHTFLPVPLKVTQAPSGEYSNLHYHKLFEDYYLEGEGVIKITNPEYADAPLYNGRKIGSLNLTEFAKQLFYDKVIPTDAVYQDLKLMKEIQFDGNSEYYIYDYSGKDSETDITAPYQVFNYYDPRQYIFFSIFNHIDVLSDIKINEMYQFSNMSLNHKYNYTLYGDEPEYKLYYKNGLITQIGAKYEQKCTKARYAVYYINPMGGWNWALFEGNKQIMKDNNTFSTYFKNGGTNQYLIKTKTTVDLTSLYLTDEQSKLLRHLYKSPCVLLHNLENGEIGRVNIETKSFTEKTFYNQGRKYFTHNISLSNQKENKIY